MTYFVPDLRLQQRLRMNHLHVRRLAKLDILMPRCMLTTSLRQQRTSAKRFVAVSIADAGKHEKARPWSEAGLSSFPQDQRAPQPNSDQYLARTAAGAAQLK